jgi:hypothetical protein
MHIPAALIAYTFVEYHHISTHLHLPFILFQHYSNGVLPRRDEDEPSMKGWPFSSASVADWLAPRNNAHRYSEVVVVNLPTPGSFLTSFFIVFLCLCLCVHYFVVS